MRNFPRASSRSRSSATTSTPTASSPTARCSSISRAKAAAGRTEIEVDAEGNVYAAIQTATPGVRVYSPDGAEIDRVNTPLRPANLTLARDRDGGVRMFIAATTSLLSIPAKAALRRF